MDSRSSGLKLTYPKMSSLKEALQWANTQEAWVQAEFAKRQAHAQPITPNKVLHICGEAYTFLHDAQAPKRAVQSGAYIRIGGSESEFSARALRWIKAEALRILTQETHKIAAQAGVVVTKVGITDTKSRWGSCSSTGAIRYNWRIVLAPYDVTLAIVAHEVAHRIHMNHSPAFHALAGKLSGGVQHHAMRWLKAHGQKLHGFGAMGS